MTWQKTREVLIAVAVVLVVTAHAPAVVTDPLYLAVAQIRVNAATTPPVVVDVRSSEMLSEPVTTKKRNDVKLVP